MLYDIKSIFLKAFCVFIFLLLEDFIRVGRIKSCWKVRKVNIEFKD